MALVVLGTPSQVPAPAQRLRTPMEHTWTGWDGSEWDLTGSRSTGVYLRPGVRGLNMAEVVPYLSELAGVNGSQYRGHRLTRASVFWPLSLWHDGNSQDWIDYDSAFWRTMQPGKLGTWTVRQPSGAARHLRLQFASDGDHAIDWDPGQMGWTQYGVYLRADQPLWEGDPVVRSWEPQESQPFFGGDLGGGFGPPFYISSGQTLANARMDNPGDVEAWPVWTITGPVDTVSVGVAGRTVTVPFPLLEGESLVIDTRPTEQTAFKGTTELTSSLGAADFAPIPAGDSRPLSLSMVGAGRVEARLVPLFLRAW